MRFKRMPHGRDSDTSRSGLNRREVNWVPAAGRISTIGFVGVMTCLLAYMRFGMRGKAGCEALTSGKKRNHQQNRTQSMKMARH